MTAIDIHCHAIPPLFVAAVQRGDFADVLGIFGENLIFHAPDGVTIEPGLRLRPIVHDSSLILDTMAGLKIDIAAVSSPPEFFMYWAPPEAGERIARIVNDGYAEWARAFPARLSPLATVPMQDAARACHEARRAIELLGLRGVAICTHVNGIDLDDRRFDPFYTVIEELGVPLFLHPQNAGEPARLAAYHLWNLVGFPTETATAAARMILSGVFARHPRLKVVLAHGGGFFPYQLGRLDHGWEMRPALREACLEKPSAYLRQIWCDSLVHDPAALAFLVRRVGEDHVVLGTDHPFDMGDRAPLASLAQAGLSPRINRKITGGTLASLLGLK